MTRKLFALFLTCLLAVSAVGCGGSSASGETSAETETETAYTLGIVMDSDAIYEDYDTIYEDYEAALDEYGYSMSAFDDYYEDFASYEEEFQVAVDNFISCGCSVILFTAKGSADFAEAYSDELYEEYGIEILIADSAYENAAPIVYMTKEYTLSCGTLKSQRFYGDVAWTGLEARETGEEAVGLINKRGEIIYINENGESTTPFINGLSAVYTDTGFVIVNADGQEVYTCTDERMTLLGQADDGTFIIEKHETGFDVNTRTFCILSSSLELEDTGIELEGIILSDINGIITIEDGVYLIHTASSISTFFSILNLNRKTYFDSYYDAVSYRGRGDDGKKIYMFVNACSYLVPSSILSEAVTADELIEMIENNDSCTSSEGIFRTWRGGTFYYDGAYHDVYGNILLSMPEFPDGVSYEAVSDFCGGYAVLYLTGVDGGQYVTIIDESGNLQYDPIPCENHWGGLDDLAYYGGYIFDDGVIDPTGEHKNLGDDLSGLAGANYIKSWWSGGSIRIGGDFIWTPNKFVSVDGSITIETATANYNENGELIYTDENGNYVVNDYSTIDMGSSDVDSTDIDSSDPYTESSQTNELQ